MAYALNLPSTYYEGFQAMYAKKRAFMLSALDGAGMKYFAPQGTYFVLADFSAIFDGTSLECVMHLIKEYGIAAIPPETFYSQEHAHIGRNYVRFAFCKSDEMLQQAQKRLVAKPKEAKT
jgi:N-succinyldiaminopimelate aminotransferase